jgi:RNA-directed DNA polymerase
VRSIVESADGVAGFLEGLRAQLKTRTFQPLPVRERMIPKPGSGKKRRLGIPTVADRVVQASLKLMLEPILESISPRPVTGRPKRRAQDAIEEIRFYAQRGYEWVFEGDIAACFDEISHTAVMDRLRNASEISGSWGWSSRFWETRPMPTLTGGGAAAAGRSLPRRRRWGRPGT